MKNFGLFVGRFLIGAIFIYSGVIKILYPLGEIGYMRMYDIPAAGVFLIGAIAVELIAGLFFILGLKTRIVGTVLIVFLAITTFIFHSKFSDISQQVHLLKNLAIIGGLLHITISGSSGWGVEKS